MLACSVGYVPIISLLAENPTVKKNAKDKDGLNAVYYAAHYGKLNALIFLKGIDIPYEPSLNGTTPLHGAVRKNHIEIVKFLL
jgi:ankyrin repeat protein